MVVTIEQKESQVLLGRTLIKAHASFDGATPKRNDIRKQVAKELKVKDEQVIIRHIYTGFGKNSATVDAVLYDNAQDAIKLEHKKLVEKHGLKADAAPVAEGESKE